MPELTTRARFPQRQVPLFCRCGALPVTGGSCRTCYYRGWRSAARFGGNREWTLARDGHRCRLCGGAGKPVVHHRRPGKHSVRLLITLCRRCHARIHRLRAPRTWLPPLTALLWEEQHPGVPRQLQFDLAGAG